MEKDFSRIAYFMNDKHPTLGDVSVYHMYIDGRLVFKIYVPISESHSVGGDHPVCHPIWVATNDDGRLVRTDAHARMKTDEASGADRISSDSVKTGVVHYLPWIFADLFVPKIV